VPLRSVEAATRDDAIAAAREQFGPSARVVGVRRVRSGGVLGFFATERYVAEVAPDLTNRPAVPRAATQDESPSDFASPLAAAAPARARTAAPARNGAAAWAAEAARTAETPAPARSSSPASRSAAPAARTSAPSWQAAAPKQPADDDRVSELASLLASKQADSDAPAYARSTFPRASSPRTAPERTTPSYPARSLADEPAPASAGRDADRRVLPADEPDAPSPFTAALARMVAGDKDVRQAVEEALVRPGTARPVAEARPVGPRQSEESAVPSPPARQEEEPVGDQVIAPSSSTHQTVEVPTWAAEPEALPSSGSSREEAIAEVLRSALAQGHSDDALAGILRKVLAGASPQTALTAPDAPVVPPTPHVVPADDVLPEVASSPFAASDVEAPVAETITQESALPSDVATDVTDPVELSADRYADVEMRVAEFPAAELTASEIVVPEVVVQEPAPVLEAPVQEAPANESTVFEAAYEAPVSGTPVFATVPLEELAFETPAFDLPVHEVPATGATMFEVPVFEPRAATPGVRPVDPFASVSPSWTPAPAWVLSPATSMWGPPSMSATLWGESASPVIPTSTPIWGEVASPEPVAPVEGSLFEEPVQGFAEETATDVDDVDELAADEVVADEPVADSSGEEPEAATHAEIDETVVADALDEESIEELAPVLARTASDPAPMMSFDSTSVMPPLSLLPPLPGSRGRGRPPVPPTPSRRSAASSVATPVAPPAEPEAPQTDATAPTADVWAPPVEAPAGSSLATVTRLPVAPVVEPVILELPERLFAPSGVGAGTTSEPNSTGIATGSVADQLVELGVPRSLLGATFAEDVAARGTYSALTRALALRLPTAPEIPSGAGEVLCLVGPGVETLRAAQSLAASLRLDPDRVQWATRGDLAGLAPESSRVTTVGAAMSRRDDAAVAGTVTIVAVDAPMRADAYWTAQMLAIWSPVAVWAVVEATRKPEDLEPWLARLPQVDAIVVQDTDLSADPAAVLRRVDAPVALLDGARATPHRWASLLCERLENPQT
jgi:hypothetical protein